jgi:hypothetical protein
VTDSAEFFALATERELIRRNRLAGKKPPWTLDPVLQAFRFCNVFREDDATTTWFRDNLRDPLKGCPQQVTLATVAFRLFNYVPTGEILKPHLLTGWDPVAVRRALIQRNERKVISGAYMITSPAGYDKATGLVHVIDTFAKMLDNGTIDQDDWLTLQDAHRALGEVPFLGRFHAYEVVTDLRWTSVLENATDINTWASAGPGCARGLQWVTGRRFNWGAKADQAEMLSLMTELLAESLDKWSWPEKPWELREVEHWLCEYDKWKRGCAGQRLKRRFHHA